MCVCVCVCVCVYACVCTHNCAVRYLSAYTLINKHTHEENERIFVNRTICCIGTPRK